MLKKYQFVVLVYGLLIGVLIYSCALNPVTGRHELMLLSESDEINLGRKTDDQIIKEYGLYEDSRLSSYINEIGQRLARVSHRPHLSYHFKILDASVINAFAVPGGYVYLSRGILAALNSEAELAGVIGHEIGHIAARHSARQYSKAQLAQLGFGVGSIFTESIPILSSLAQLGVGMLFLKFSRDNEREADDLGVEYSTKAGYDATQMATFFEVLERMNPSSDRSGLPGWFSTHPSPEDRIKVVRRRAIEWQNRFALREMRINRDGYLKMIDGLVFGDDPQQGYIMENEFYHPILRFHFPVPPGWKVNNRPSQIQIVNESQDAIILFYFIKENFSINASRDFISKTGASVVRLERITIDGLPSHRLISDHRTQQGVLRVISYFIEKDRRVYVFHGLSSIGRFQNYLRVFDYTMGGFKELKDPRKINVHPNRISIRPARSSDTLGNILRSFGTPEDKLKEMALLNGGEINQFIIENTLIKVIEKGY